MKDKIKIAASMALVCLLALAVTGCLEEKVVEIVVTDETSAEWPQDEDAINFTETAVINYGDEVDQILKDNGYSRSEIKEARVIAAYYGVTAYDDTENWMIGGKIVVRRTNPASGDQTLIEYTDVSVPGSLGKKVHANLSSAGVDILNDALADFIAGENPELEFEVQNDEVSPAPDSVNRMVFTWKAWLKVQVIVEGEFEVPDPF